MVLTACDTGSWEKTKEIKGDRIKGSGVFIINRGNASQQPSENSQPATKPSFV